MTTPTELPETILVVDDEPDVRRTFEEWLQQSGFGCTILAAADAEQALKLANQQPIDLAILDWNLGAGADGLHLLQDLIVFHPDIVAILVTGYAQQATPLDAMRMGVRDYLDKNHDLDRATFLKVVQNQLDQIRPARRERLLHRSLAEFREAVQKIVPLVQQSALLNDPVPVTSAVRTLFVLLLETTGAQDGVLLVRSYDAERNPPETFRAYDQQGSLLDVKLEPFASSLVGGAASMQEICIWEPGAARLPDGISLQPFERHRQNILAAPLTVASGVSAIIELFDKPGGFTAADKRIARAGADVGTELLRQSFAERQSQRLLIETVEAALGASESLAATMQSGSPSAGGGAAGAEALNSLRENLQKQLAPGVESDEVVRLLQAIRAMAATHGAAAIRHALRVVDSTSTLLAHDATEADQ
jgi:two-component system, NtrC family, nitrogen regulation response regulator NtrX